MKSRESAGEGKKNGESGIAQVLHHLLERMKRAPRRVGSDIFAEDETLITRLETKRPHTEENIIPPEKEP